MRIEKDIHKLIVVLFTFLVSAMVVYSADMPEPDEKLVYKTAGKSKLYLHVFKPEGHKSSDKRSCIVFFFGGGWTGGSPTQFYMQAKHLAGKGMVAISAEYRVKNTHGVSPFECVEDGKSAIRWVRKHAAELGVDPKRIVASGGSAGGHVAACTGVIKGYEEESEDKDVSSVPNAMVLFNPVLDTTTLGYGSKRFDLKDKEKISPCHHVSKGQPPTLLFHGTEDRTVPFGNAQRFTKLMGKAMNNCRLAPFEGKDHGFFNGKTFRKSNTDDDYNETMKLTVSFLKSLGYIK